MAQERKLRLPHAQKKAKRMNQSDFEIVLQEIDYVEKSLPLKIQHEVQLEFRRCGLSNVGNQIGSLVERMEALEQRVNFQERAQEGMKDLCGSIVEKVVELHEASEKHLSRIQIQNRSSRKLVIIGQNHEQRLVQLEEGAVVSSGNSKGPTGDGGNGGKARCPFCGKELTIKYLGTHMKRHCKKGAGIYAAAALYEQAPDSP